LLVGACHDALAKVDRLVDGLPSPTLGPGINVRAAAEAARRARASGRTVRSSTDCRIAALATRHEAVAVHHHRDFDVLAPRSTLRTVRWD